MTPETGRDPTGTVPVSAPAFKLDIENPFVMFAVSMLANSVSSEAVLTTPAIFKLFRTIFPKSWPWT